MFSIKSSASDRELRFLEPRPDYFTVQLRGAGFEVAQEVYAYRDARALSNLLSKLAALERPWAGEERWESLEGELSLAIICSKRGKVVFGIDISHVDGSAEDWHVSADLATDFGQLPHIAKEAASFFDIVAGA